MSLGPLESEAVAEFAARCSRATPTSRHSSHRTLEEVRFCSSRLLLGLWEEERVRVAGGQAELVDGRLPDRVHEGMRERVARLSEASSNAVTVAASLGRTFSFVDLRARSACPRDSPPVAELIQADLLVEQDES